MQTEVRGVQISYETVGSGRPFVWGHGLTSSRADDGKPPVMIDWERVANHVEVTRYDARGHGESAFTAEPEGYSWAELSKDQLELLDQLGMDRVILGGASMGAATACTPQSECRSGLKPSSWSSPRPPGKAGQRRPACTGRWRTSSTSAGSSC